MKLPGNSNFQHRKSNKLWLFGFWICVFCLILGFGFLSFSKVKAAPLRQIPLTARLATADFSNATGGTYSIRLAIYSVDRTTSDPFPSNADAGSRVWEETKNVTLSRGFFRTFLGDTTALPATVDFNSGTFYLGVRVGTDPEMVPRFKIGSAPFAINSTLLQGLEPGNSANNLLKLNASAGIDLTGQIKTSGGLDLQNSQASNFRVENLISDPTAGQKGRILFNTTEGVLKVDTGTTIQSVGGSTTVTLQGAYDAGNTITSSNSRDISITLADTATDSNFVINIASGSTGKFAVQNAGSDVLRVTSSGLVTGTISSGTWQGTAIGDTYVADTLTTDTSSSIQWTGLTGYPAACSAGSAVSTLADSPTCTSFNTDTSITLQDAYNATSGNSITTTTARNIALTFAADTSLTLDAATTDTTTTTGVIDLDVDSDTGSASAVDINFEGTGSTASLTQNAINVAIIPSNTTNARTYRGINLSATDAGAVANTLIGLNIDTTTANSSDTTYAAIFQGGNVGVGTATPSSNNVFVAAGDRNPESVGDWDSLGQIHIRGVADTNEELSIGYDTTDRFGWLQASVEGGQFEELILNPGGGNVGIGDTTPAQLLVVGSGEKFTVTSAGITGVNFNSTATIAGVCHSGVDIDAATDATRDLVPCSAAPDDYAEWHETESAVDHADVVVVTDQTFTYDATQSDPFTGLLKEEKVRRSLPMLAQSQSAYSDQVLGVISTSPIQTIGSDVKHQGQHPMPLALAGRVPVKVTTHNGQDPIKRGDYLVASEITGIAMKYDSNKVPVNIVRVGIIGIALDDTDRDGKVMMLVRNFVIEKPTAEIAQNALNHESGIMNQELEKLTVTGPAIVHGPLTISGQAEFQSNVDFKGQVVASTVQVVDLTVSEKLKTKILEVMTEAVFRGQVVVKDLEIEGHLTVGKDVAGTVVIPAGETLVEVKFDRPYDRVPKVTTSVSDFVVVKVENKTVSGFTIRIKEPLPTDLAVDWIAVESNQ